VVPDFGHIIPVVYNTVLNGIAELKDSLLGLGFLSDISFFIVHADHDVFIFWSADDGGER
jgi:hypothetical protein